MVEIVYVHNIPNNFFMSDMGIFLGGPEKDSVGVYVKAEMR